MIPFIRLNNGIRVYASNLCLSDELVQYKFPKSKKSRIRKKWSKQNKNYRIEEVERACLIDSKLFVSHKSYNMLISNASAKI